MMRVLRKLKLNLNKDQKTIFFGIPTDKNEEGGMFDVRKDVYEKRRYILPGASDRDKYDINNVSTYFIAKVDSEIVGAVRLIKSDPLPTEIHYAFTETEDLKNIPREKRAELGRLVVRSPKGGGFFPRGIVLLFLLDVVVSYAEEQGLLGGMSFIKFSLLKKLKDRKMPLKLIEDYKFNVKSHDVLYPYFTQEHDPVIPVYFITKNFRSYIDKIFSNRFVFKKSKEENDTLILRNTWLFSLSTLYNFKKLFSRRA